MANQVEYWATEIYRHVPLVTTIGLSLSAGFGVAFVAKRWRDAGLLAMVCAAYAITPFLPSWY